MATVETLSLDCRERDCPVVPDIGIYSLEDRLAFNGTPLSFIEQCPTGYFCPVGSFPRVFTYPPGTFVIPKPPTGTGFPIVVQLAGCTSNVSIVLPPTATEAQVNTAAQQVINQVAAQQAKCDAIKVSGPLLPTTIQLSDIQEATCLGAVFSATIFVSPTSLAPYSFTLKDAPGWLSGTPNAGHTRFLLSGTPSVTGPVTFTVQVSAAGGSGSKDYTLQVAAITNSSPLPDAKYHLPYSETLTAAGITGTLVWSVTSGTLPAGLSLDSSTGEISGTPSEVDGEVADFTVLVTNGLIFCTKDFQIEVLDSGWPFIDMVWATASLAFAPHSSVTVVATGNICTVVGTSDGVNSFLGGGLGTLTYTGPALNCKATCNFSSVTPGVTVRILNSTTTVPVINSVNTMPAGQTVFLFTIPLSVAQPYKFFGQNLAGQEYFYGDFISGNFSLILEIV